VDSKSGYPVAFRGNYSGSYAPIKFEGDFGVQLALTGINTNAPVNLPAACDKPICLETPATEIASLTPAAATHSGWGRSQ